MYGQTHGMGFAERITGDFLASFRKRPRNNQKGKKKNAYFCIMSWTNSLSVGTYVSSLFFYAHCTPWITGSRVGRQCPHTVNPAITVLVSFPNHFVNFVIGELLANRGHDMAQLCSRNEAVVIAVEDLECFPDLLLGIGVLHLPCHHGQEFCCGIDVNYSLSPFCFQNTHRIPGKSIVPLLSASTSLIMSCSSDSEGFWPRERITVPNSLVVIWPVVQIEVHQYTDCIERGGRHFRRRISRSETIA